VSESDLATAATSPPAVGWRVRLRRAMAPLGTASGSVALALVVGVVLGAAITRTIAADAETDARVAIETQLLPLALNAEGIWASSSDTRGSVGDALVAMRRDGSTQVVEENAVLWLEAYDLALLRIAGLSLPPNARPVQRQVLAAVTLSRDAVEVLDHAATVHAVTGDDGQADEQVEALLVEVGRLRQRSEQVLQAARVAAGDLAGQRVDVGPLGELPPFPPRRP
jgi:hypothetical protein